MNQKFTTLGLLLIAVVTNSYALIQYKTPNYADDKMSLLTWCVVTMGASLVSMLIYFFNGLKNDVKVVHETVSAMNERLIKVEVKINKED